MVVSLASSLTGLFVFTPALVAHADTAQRTSWNAVSKQMYRLENNQATQTSWVPMDPSKLVLSVTPAVDSTAVLSAFSDVEAGTTTNTDIGIEVGTTLVAWKEGGEYTAGSPDPVYVQAPYTMYAGQTYNLVLVWKARTAEAPGVSLEAGDPVPPYGPLFSPTTLNALLTPIADSLVASAASTGSAQFNWSSASWELMDSSVERSFTTPAGTSNYNALLTASADLYSSSSAFTNADIGICFAAAATINSTCTSTGASIIASQTSGSATGSMPIASLVEATQTLAPSTTYTMGLFWQAETAHAIYAGALDPGTTNLWSPSSVIAQLTPTADSEQTTATTGIQTRSYSGSDDGTNWTTIGGDTYTVTPAVNVLDYLTGNATLSKSTGTPPIDFGICVTTGTDTCTTGSHLVDFAAVSSLSGTQTAAYLQMPVFMTANTTYTVSLEWAAATAMSSGQSMTAGVNATLETDNNTLTSLQVPYSAPSAPPSVSATAGNGQATVSWSASTLSPGSPLTGYAITPWLGTVSLETMHVGLVSSFTVPNLANGQTYSFSVAGVNADGAGATTSSGTVTPGLPGAPTGVSIGSRGNGFENLSWTAPGSTGASAVTGYLITPYIAGVAQATTTLWGTATSATVTGLTDGTTYTFGVAAINAFGTGAAGTSGANNPYTQTPGAPTAVTGTAGNGQATVSWTAPSSDGGSAITSYTITPYIGGTAQSTTSVSASPGTVTGLTNGTTYTFTVAAVNGVGTGTASGNSWAVVPATTPVVPSMTLAVDKGASATYAIGTTVTYSATISSNAGAATTASFTDPLPPGVSGSGGSILVNGSACTGGTTCTATATTISVSGLTIPATGNVVVTYAVTVVGTLRSCALETDNASVTIASGNSVGGSAPFTACDSDLGTNAWNSTITQTLGDRGSAGVNPANGNLVVTQTDAIPMQLHGGLSFHLTRTYNSQDTDLAGLSAPVGNGWIVSFVDAGSQPGGVGLIVPAIESYANPTPITMVDGSGTRYVYTPSALSTVINVGSLSTTGPLATAIPNNLPKTSGYNQRCIDEEYNPPTGLHVSMWRYLETTGTCTTLSTSSNLIIGYVAIGTDRVRREYNALGELINLQDAAGNTVFYSYTSGNLTSVTETGNSRKFKLVDVGSTVTITDPGGEKTIYTDTSGNLTAVANPDGTGLSYTYGGCTGASSIQLCSAKDGRGNATTFSYTAAPAGPALVSTVVDRNGNTTTVTYNSTNVTADRGSERTAYAAIDASGRVGEVDAGSTSNAWLHRTFYGWDTAASGCRQPDAGVDNDLCFIIRRGLTAGAPDRVTDYTYGDEGQMLAQRDINSPSDLYTTAGYQAEYFEANVSVATYTDSVAGSGSVMSTTQTGGRRDGGTLFDVITQTQSLTPRGNAAGSGYATYLSTFLVDNNSAVSTNTVNSATSLCGLPTAPTANTGLLCEIDAPSFDGTHTTRTDYTYNPDGTRASMTTPKENAESLGNKFLYTYYQNADKDLSGTTSAGGWLKGITDPTGNFTSFAYDAEGHQVRSWDRNATFADGVALSSTNWDSLTSAPADYTEKLYTDGGDTLASTFSAPSRYGLASRTQLGEWTTDTVDSNGNLIGSRTANGTGGSPTSTPRCPQPTTGQTSDTCRTYDKNDNVLTTLTPMEANTVNYASQKFTTYTYDAFDNRVSTTDPNGNVTTTLYDSLNRPTEKFWTMAVWAAMPAPTGCIESTSANAPIPSGEIMCFSTIAYDGVDNPISTTNGSGHTSYALYDAVHRAIVSTTPRNDGIFTNLVTVTLYNPDGQVTDVCPPRELSEGSGDSDVCNSTSTYGTHTTYNAAGWVASTSAYQVAGTPDTTTYAYDADGNKTTITNANGFPTTYQYSVLDRMSSMTVPRTSATAYTTSYGYDPSGDETYAYAPIDGTNLIRTEYTYDADHRVIDTIKGASVANSTAPYSGTTGTDVRTRNVYDPDGNVIEQYQPNAFTASGVTPDADYATAAAYNADNEQTAVYKPRYDTATHTPSLTDPVGSTQTPTQAADCPTGGVSGFGYASTLGICTTSYLYDPDGNVSVVNWPTQTSSDKKPLTTYSYTNTNLVLTETDPNPNAGGGTVTAETYAYDAEGKQTAQTDANGIYTDTAYWADERVAATTHTPNATTTHITSYLYDANGDQMQVTDAVGNSALTAYYPDGLTKSVTDGMGDETSYVYDAVGNPTAIFSPDANAKAAANPNGTPTYNVYTEDNLLEATLIPVNSTDSQRAVCYTYDQSGRKTGQGNWLNTGVAITTEPPACGGGVPANSFAFTNLPDGRLAKETGRNGSSALAYTYDADGNQLTSTDPTTTTTDTYYADNLLRTAQDMTSNDRTTDYAYDGAGKVTGRNSVPSSGTTYEATIAYNDADLQATETNSISTDTVTWSYDPGGRLVQIANDLGTEYYGYAADGTLDGESVLDDASLIIDSVFSQTLDGDYRVTSDGCTTCENTAGSASVGHTFTYQYDAAGRLIFINASGGYAAFQTYDQDGNRITHDDVVTDVYTTYTYNADNSIATTILSRTPVSATYDTYGAGVMTSDGCTKWTLDTFDRATAYGPVSIPPSVCPNGPPPTTYTYDANGTMLTEAAGGTTTTIHNDATTSTPIVENVGSTTTTAYVLDSNGTPMEAGQGSTVLYLWNDPKGDLSTVMDNASLYPTCELQYDPYGTVVFGLSPSNQCESGSTFVDLLYQNSRRDSSSGTYQLGSRTYDPSKNSFLSPDHYQLGASSQDLSIQVDPLTENAYTFVDGDPVNLFDPTGHHPAYDQTFAGEAQQQMADYGAALSHFQSTNANANAASKVPVARRGYKAYVAGMVRQIIQQIKGGIAADQLGARVANHLATSDSGLPFGDAPWGTAGCYENGLGVVCPSAGGDYQYSSAPTGFNAWLTDNGIYFAAAPLAALACIVACPAIGAAGVGSAVVGSGAAAEAVTQIEDEGASAAAGAADITSQLQAHIDQAASDYADGTIGMTERQAAAAAANERLAPMFRGWVIDKFAKQYAMDAGLPDGVRVTMPGQAGPDFVQWGADGSPTGIWWDATTNASWQSHLDQYVNIGIQLPTG
ncbi:MAG: fibronectin type III domain-containing protein [Candidatus Dormibacteria bacterium]